MLRWTLIACLLCAYFTCCLTAGEPTMRLRLGDGSFGAGEIVGVDHPDQLGWQSQAFESPFHFDVRAIRSVASVVDSPEKVADQPVAAETDSGQLIELSDGGMIVGRLVDMDDSWITVDSPLLGQLKIARSAATAMVDAGYAGRIVYSGPIDDEHWQRLTAPEDWEFEAGALVATKQGAAIVGNVELPTKSQINLSMSWRGAPDFVLSLGTSANNKVSKVDEVPSAARLEVWANQLALVREVDREADIAMLSDLSGANPRIDLTIYLDQQAGTIMVCDSHGRPLETLEVPSEKAVSRPSVHLANNGPSLTVERFEVREWDGLTSTVSSGERSVLDAAGENRKGGIVGYDAEQRALRVAWADGQQTLLPLDQLRRGDFATPEPSSPTTEPTTEPTASPALDDSLPPVVVQPPTLDPDSSSPAPAGQAQQPALKQTGEIATTQPDKSTISRERTPSDQSLEIILVDRTRLSGRLLATDNPQTLHLAATGLSADLSIPCESVRGVIGCRDRFIADDGDQVVGTLKVDGQQLTGYLDEIPQPKVSSASGLYWHPSGSLNASAISQSASGAIVYRKPLPAPANAVPRYQFRPAADRARVLAPAVGMFLGNNPANRENSSTKPQSTTAASAPEAREIMFRTGDAVDGMVERIDEHGMTFRSSQTTTTFAPHELIQHVWLNRTNDSQETSPEKLKRLMTVPRSMKSDPPTHLFVAVTGDYLRGRLVRLEGDRLTIEVRLELVELSTSQIGQIVWLHDRDWSDKPAPKNQGEQPAAVVDAAQNATQPPPAAGEGPLAQFLVHAIGRSDRGLTFLPEKLADGVLSGHSDLLGKCSIAVDDLNQLLFGRNISAQVRDFRADPWTLSLAQYPRVYLDDGSESSAPASENSVMVGKPATDFLLKSLDGEAFRLSKNRERIVVLDFWASWCGPCIQTMPLVEEVVNELGADKIHLVAVNIQETEARARAAVDRLQMTSTVLLDIDGQTAAVYMANAIPQTVIIDRQGIVTHVFVGGGPKFVAQFRQALLSAIEGSPTE